MQAKNATLHIEFLRSGRFQPKIAPAGRRSAEWFPLSGLRTLGQAKVQVSSSATRGSVKALNSLPHHKIVLCRSALASTARSGGSSVESLRSLFPRTIGSSAITELRSWRSTRKAKAIILYICARVTPQRNAKLQQSLQRHVARSAMPALSRRRLRLTLILHARNTLKHANPERAASRPKLRQNQPLPRLPSRAPML